jgi:hypothetical protein
MQEAAAFVIRDCGKGVIRILMVEGMLQGSIAMFFPEPVYSFLEHEPLVAPADHFKLSAKQLPEGQMLEKHSEPLIDPKAAPIPAAD